MSPADHPSRLEKTVSEPTEQQVEGLARAWFARDFEDDAAASDEWDRLEPDARENCRSNARWMWQYVEEQRG